jgi:hypothetical protein
MRYQNKIDTNLKYALAYLNIDKKSFTKKVFRKLNKFLYYIYWSLPYEQNARVQELYPYVLKYDINELKELPQYKNVIDMIEFNAYDYYHELLIIIPNRTLDKVLDKTLKEFIKTYKNSHEDLDELLDDTVLTKKSIEEIFHYYEKIINRGGENMRKKILRLYSLKNQMKR